MKIIFQDEYLEELAENKEAGKRRYPTDVETAFKKRIFQIKHLAGTQDLRDIKSLHFEKLKEKRYSGKYSIQLNKAFRLIFQIGKDESLEVIIIEEINNHYG